MSFIHIPWSLIKAPLLSTMKRPSGGKGTMNQTESMPSGTLPAHWGKKADKERCHPCSELCRERIFTHRGGTKDRAGEPQEASLSA